MNYNPKNYEEVKDRLARFLKDHPDARIVTRNLTTPADRDALTWVVQTKIYLPMWEISKDWKLQEYPENNWFLKATGLAFEIDGVGGMANKTSALENCETSSIGRALANCGYGGDRRVTAEEMSKVERGISPARDWIKLSEESANLDELRKVYGDARKANASVEILQKIQEKADAWILEAEKSSKRT
jgi:hypothetical protein